MVKKYLIVGNWKMFLTSQKEAKKFISTLKIKIKTIKHVDAWIAPPFTLLPLVSEQIKKTSPRIGAQSVSSYKEGAHTGGVSATMLKNSGATFVIVGHSERRQEGETDVLVREQIIRANELGLLVILCVGEKERDQADEYFSIIAKQIETALEGYPKTLTKKIVIAYEPLWAIGKSADESIKPSDLQEMQIFIRKILTNIFGRQIANSIPILYGGSVEPINVKALLVESGVSGFLVGRASADVSSFIQILSACKK